MFRAVDLHELAQAIAPSTWLVWGRQAMPTVDPQPIRDHPLSQGLDAHTQSMPCGQLLRRQRRTEIRDMLAHQGQNGSAECLAVAVITGSVRFGAIVTSFQTSLRASRLARQILTAPGSNVSTELLIPASL